jgi:cytidine deaminase
VEGVVAQEQTPSLPISLAQQEALVAAARSARRHAYAPYSRFRVGAAILTSHGEIVTGCNVENISYGLTNCAERTAVFTARAAGNLGAGGRGAAIVAVAVVAQGATTPSPCGACRQVLNEFGPNCLVICANLRGDRRVATLAALLPDAFGPW